MYETHIISDNGLPLLTENIIQTPTSTFIWTHTPSPPPATCLLIFRLTVGPPLLLRPAYYLEPESKFASFLNSSVGFKPFRNLSGKFMWKKWLFLKKVLLSFVCWQDPESTSELWSSYFQRACGCFRYLKIQSTNQEYRLIDKVSYLIELLVDCNSVVYKSW